MPRNSAVAVPTVEIPSALMDELVKGPMSAAAVQAAELAFKKALTERVMGAGLSHHLGYRAGETPTVAQTHHRNGHSEKTVPTEDGPVRIAVPRSGRRVRAGVDPEAYAELHGIRRQDHRDVRARHDGARDPGVPP